MHWLTRDPGGCLAYQTLREKASKSPNGISVGRNNGCGWERKYRQFNMRKMVLSGHDAKSQNVSNPLGACLVVVRPTGNGQH